MKLSHTRAATSAVFDDPESGVGRRAGPGAGVGRRGRVLHGLADEHLSVPTDKGANAGLKVASLVAGMVAGADSIDDMALLRHGGMGRVFDERVRALDAGLVPARVHLRPRPPARRGRLPVPDRAGHRRRRWCRLAESERVLVDVDDTIIEVHGYAKQGAGFGYSGVRGLNALLATVTTAGVGAGDRGPTAAQRLVRLPARGEAAGRRRAQDRRHPGRRRSDRKPLLRADSAFYGPPTVGAAIRGGADVSVTVRLDPKVKKAIAAIGDDAWTPIEYTDAVFDEPPAAGSPGPRSPRSPSPRSPRKKAASGCPGGWWCAASPT